MKKSHKTLVTCLCFVFLFIHVFPLFGEVKYFRSNYNGLLLLEIKEDRKDEFLFYARAQYNEEELLTGKVIFQEGNEIKRWEYFYTEGVRSSEKFYKDGVLAEHIFYDAQEHKSRQLEYKKGKMIRSSDYSYNKNGLVYLEVIKNYVTDKTIRVKYKYDKYFRIKQIIKEFDDGKVIYWDAFFSSKGIITKEYYTLDDEVYIFYYNLSGRELKGEVVGKENEKETIKITWENSYDSQGIKIQKEEYNYVLQKRINTFYNKDGKETKIAEYVQDSEGNYELELITEYEYDEESRIKTVKTNEGLDEVIIQYTYNPAGKVGSEKHIIDGSLKKEVIFEESGGRTEIIYGKSDVTVRVRYDRDGNILSQETK